MAANTQGLATLQMLNILENFDLRGMGFQSSASIHAQVEQAAGVRGSRTVLCGPEFRKDSD